VVTALIVVRLPPLSTVPEEYIADPDTETDFSGGPFEYLRFAVSNGVEKTKRSPTVVESTFSGLLEGIKLTATLAGTVLVIGVLALGANTYTSIFDIASTPLVPIMSILAIPEPKIAATATIVGFAEVIVATSIAAEASLITKFFVTILVASQAIFLAAPIPIMMDMFDDIPIKFKDLTILFVLRTIILIPLAAILTHLVVFLGLLG
jgi:nucleoside recognition membrane protein YjiH